MKISVVKSNMKRSISRQLERAIDIVTEDKAFNKLIDVHEMRIYDNLWVHPKTSIDCVQHRIQKHHTKFINMAQPVKDITLQSLITEGKNPRGIPASKFIEDVEEFLGDVSVESALGAFNELYSKYKYMETSFERSKNVYKSKIPEIEQTLELIKLMIKKEEDGDEMVTNYNICDTIYAAAKVDTECKKVFLWIGASTMVEYSYEEALKLLETQLEQSHAKIAELQEDLYHLRGNSITVEVNMARLFNHSVKIKKMKEATAAKK